MAEDRIARIRELEGTADHSETRSDADHWEAARLIWEELSTGKSQRQLAEEIGKSGTHIMWASRCWEIWGRNAAKPSLRPPWREAYTSDDVRRPRNAGPRRFRLTPREQALATMPYAQYLATEEWAAQRKAALERADHACQVCGRTNKLQVHHRTYERRGHEQDSDLTVLCEDCHLLYERSGKVTTEDSQPGDTGQQATTEQPTPDSRWIAPLRAATEPITQRAVWSLLAADDIAVVERCARDLAKIVGPARSAAARRVARSRGTRRAKAS